MKSCTGGKGGDRLKGLVGWPGIQGRENNKQKKLHHISGAIINVSACI